MNLKRWHIVMIIIYIVILFICITVLIFMQNPPFVKDVSTIDVIQVI